jgi:YVTN family beta-propeller protein
MRRSRIPLLIASAALVLVCAASEPTVPTRPGSLGNGVTLLPNGWKIAPAGRHLAIGDLPLNMVESPDGDYLVVTNNGYTKPSLTLVDLKRGYVRQKLELDHAWLGLAWHQDGKRLYSSSGSHEEVLEIRYALGKLAKGKTFAIGQARPKIHPSKEESEGRASSFLGGLAVSPDGKRAYVVDVLGASIALLDLTTGRVSANASLPAEPYTCLVSPDGSTVYVSVWGGGKVLSLDAATLATKGAVPVGEHPNAMVLSKDAKRLFVACANTNSVWVVDLATRKGVEQIAIALYPEAPPGSTPNALGLSPDGRRLLVANADNNTVAVVDVGAAGGARVEGFIPTGWYPTATSFSRDGSRIFVLSGKGLTSAPDPRAGQPGVPGADGQYIAAMLQGTLSIVPAPDAAALKEMTKTVYNLTPYNDAVRLAPGGAPEASPIPRKVGDPSPIKHVFYVIRENRTYDQVLGDLERGNGDPNLCLFGEDVTPNAHALAREFVLLDSFYVDAEVSYDGHAFSTGAYATDFVEKMWPTYYGHRGGRFLSEGGGAMRNPYGNVTAPQNGYIWDACTRAGVSVRSYGEFTRRGPEPEENRDSGQSDVVATVPGLAGLVHPGYPPYDLKIPDGKRVDVWLREFREFEKSGKLPALSILRLGNDHTAGTSAGYPTPRAMVAENDVALGRVVEAISNSTFWKESAIFILEDDAQAGPDHVDAHRSPAFVVSPYARRGAVVSSLYTTSGMLRTMELILGLPPMSQYDAAATPMYGAFQGLLVTTPFEARPARIDLGERNDLNAWGAAASARMDLTEADLAPEQELNEILWKSAKGAASPMPPPVRAAFLRPAETGRDPD